MKNKKQDKEEVKNDTKSIEEKINADKVTKPAFDFVVNLFKAKLSTSIIYHNLLHTQRCLERFEEINDYEKLDVTEEQLAIIALIFANTGYTQSYKTVGSDSVSIAEEYLKENDFKKDSIKAISQCIECIHALSVPKTKLENIVTDAYNFRVADKNFDEYSDLIRRERLLHNKEDFTDDQWFQNQINYLTDRHVFYSTYALKNWQKRKQKNLTKLLKSKRKDKENEKKEKRKARYKQKYKNESPERGVQTLYRVALRNHIKLSDIADTKANILLSVNAIIISLVLANLISKLSDPNNRFLIIPTIIFVIFAIISMIMSIAATRPNVTRREFDKEDIKENKVNLIFFGNFHHMELNKYKETIRGLLENKEDVYDTLTMDLYYLGVVLDQKYKLLRYTYIVFMAGMIISVLAFTLAFIYRDIFTL